MTTPPQDGVHPAARLHGPTAEVESGPEGPEVGAFFDLDGTLVAGYTAAVQTRDRLRRRDLRVVEFLTIVELAVQIRLGRRAFKLIEGSARTEHIRGPLRKLTSKQRIRPCSVLRPGPVNVPASAVKTALRARRPDPGVLRHRLHRGGDREIFPHLLMTAPCTVPG